MNGSFHLPFIIRRKSSMGQLPIYIHSEKITVLLVGGGSIALRKLKSLHAAGAKVDVIATTLSDEFREFVFTHRINCLEKSYELGEATPYDLVITATNDEIVNEAVQKDASHLVCRVDHVEKGNVVIPATIRRGRLVLAVSTGGASPMLAKKIMLQLEKQFDNQYESYLEFLVEIRQTYRGNKQLLQAVVDERFINMSNSDRQKEVLQLIGLKN